MRARTIPMRFAAAATFVGVVMMLGSGAALADSATVSVSSSVSTKRAMSVSVFGITLGVYKVSNPSVTVSASTDRLSPRMAQTIHATPTPTCAAGDNPTAGYFNRTINVTVASGSTAKVYAQVQFDTTTAAGQFQHINAEPFGPAPGLSFAVPAVPGLPLPPLTVPVDLCVS